MNLDDLENSIYTVIGMYPEYETGLSLSMSGRRGRRKQDIANVRTCVPHTRESAEALAAQANEKAKKVEKADRPRYSVCTIAEARLIPKEIAYDHNNDRLDAACYKALKARAKHEAPV
jgi:hypothetical protein